MKLPLNDSWIQALASEFKKPYFETLIAFVEREYETNECFPLITHIFRAFDMVRMEDVKVVILGQDPYHTPGAAMGMAFSVPNGYKTQPSLRNIFKELEQDMGI